MNPTAILGALVEAWQEVRIQKTRVILSLVGVVAAVAAMSTVMALGDIIMQSQKEEIEAMTGRDTTIQLSIMKSETDASMMGVIGSSDDSTSADSSTSSDLETSPLPQDQIEHMQKVGWNASDIRPSVFTRATKALAARYKLTQYSRTAMDWSSFDELTKAANEGNFLGYPLPANDAGDGEPDTQVTIQACDPAFLKLFRLRLASGRWIESGDINQRVTPVVVNTSLWRNMMGSVPLSQPVTLTNSATGQQVRIVGVVRSAAQASPTIYMHYDAWELAAANSSAERMDSYQLAVWVDPSQSGQAQNTLLSSMRTLLGSKFQVDLDQTNAMMASGASDREDQFSGARMAIMGIGAIVILLGTLGLLNVAIVTVRQRVREIGIRRAVGASAKRIFVAVFLESVVATFVAGLLGVALAIIVVRFLPLSSMGIELQDTPGFPMTTALIAMAISTAIGALAGIIPAFAAVKVKPIEAIRY